MHGQQNIKIGASIWFYYKNIFILLPEYYLVMIDDPVPRI